MKDVKRIVQHKRGPFVQLLDGKPSGREFRFIELHDGQLFAEFTDGERQRIDSQLYHFWIDLGFRNGSLVEIAS